MPSNVKNIAPPKIAFVGGGSFLWGAPLLRDLFSAPELKGSEVRLYDIDIKAARLVQKASVRLQKRAKSSLTVKVSDNLNQALKGVDYVIIAIQAGGLRQLQHEIDIPAKYGATQPVSQTTGPGVVVRTMVNGPIYLDIARRMEKLCPNAWILNFTNPLTTLGRIVSKNTGIKNVGICHGVWSCRSFVSKTMNIPMDDIKLIYGGVNHGSYVFDILVRGESVYNEFKKKLLSDVDKGCAPGMEIDPLGYTSGNVVRFEALRKLGLMTSNSDRHHAEFYSYFLRDGGRRYCVRPSTAERRLAGTSMAKQYALDIASGKRVISVEAGCEPAHEIILARHFSQPYIGPVNLPNEGQIPNLPMGAVVESPGIIDGSGIHPVMTGPMPNEVLAQTTAQVAIHELAVEAAETGDIDKAIAAVAADPLTREWETIPDMVNEMIHASRKLIPYKFKPLKRAGQNVRTNDNQLKKVCEQSDRCLIDPSPYLIKEMQKKKRWINGSLVTADCLKNAKEAIAALKKNKNPAADTAAKVGKILSSFDGGYYQHKWSMHGFIADKNNTDLFFAVTQEEIATDKNGKPMKAGPFFNQYYLPAVSVTISGGKGMLRHGVSFKQYGLFAALNEIKFTDLKELLNICKKGIPEAVSDAGQKVYRSYDVLTYTFDGWKKRIPANVRSEKLLQSLKEAKTDLQLCKALLKSGEKMTPAKRHILESLAGKVYFALAE
ncbi:MAG: family 4 glycosyl hydrolase [Planctomycetota bacterium]